jgi:hypothetical protein
LVNKFKSSVVRLSYGASLILALLACTLARQTPQPLPEGQQLSFDVQTATPTATIVLILTNAPTHTPDPRATATPLATATTPLTSTVAGGETGEPVETPLQETGEAEATPEPEAPAEEEAPPPPPPPTVPVATAPPLQGGDWDFESNFVPWGNPYGEPCPGASVASGWSAFVEQGQYGSSCFNENLYKPNVFSGAKSQEITFDFIAANSGVFRVIPTQPGHRYQITAYAKHDRSIAPVQIFLGVDLTGGTAWDAGTVEWFPWNEGAEDAWTATEETVTARGTTMTLFIRGYHPMADQGGKTVFDNVSVTDLGP